MAITRVWQAGAEFNDTLLEFTSRTGSAFTTSTTAPNTGTYSFRAALFNDASKIFSTTYTQMRTGFYFRHSGAYSDRVPEIVEFKNGGTSVVSVYWNGMTNQIDLYVGGVLQNSAASAIFATQEIYHNCGLDVKIAVAGWATFYVEGVAIVTFSGDTTVGSASIDSIRFTAYVDASTAWSSYVYIDDIYVDDTSGEASAAVPPSLTFELVHPNADGTSSGLTGSDGDQINNYLLVDEVTPDDDATYVYGASSGIKDTYNMAAMSVLAADIEVQSVIPIADARKVNVALDVKYQSIVRSNVTETVGAAQAVDTAYALYWDRVTLDPNGSVAWTEAAVNAMEIGLQTAGTYV